MILENYGRRHKMNKQETIQVITLLAGNYDSIAKKDKPQKEIMVNIWYECLGIS